jgi:Domain of unknown function (DU1801)
MPQAENKTKATEAKVSDFIASVENPARRADAEALLTLYAEATGMEPKMWGPSIIGYGSYHYKYESGREGDMCRAGFSPRKANISLYLMGGYCNPDTQGEMDRLRARLGKHKTGASCLYINKLADVDLAVLREMIELDLAWMDSKYPRD